MSISNLCYIKIFSLICVFFIYERKVETSIGLSTKFIVVETPIGLSTGQIGLSTMTDM